MALTWKNTAYMKYRHVFVLMVRCTSVLRTQGETAQHCQSKLHPNTARTTENFLEVIVVISG